MAKFDKQISIQVGLVRSKPSTLGLGVSDSKRWVTILVCAAAIEFRKGEQGNEQSEREQRDVFVVTFRSSDRVKDYNFRVVHEANIYYPETVLFGSVDTVATCRVSFDDVLLPTSIQQREEIQMGGDARFYDLFLNIEDSNGVNLLEGDGIPQRFQGVFSRQARLLSKQVNLPPLEAGHRWTLSVDNENLRKPTDGSRTRFYIDEVLVDGINALHTPDSIISENNLWSITNNNRMMRSPVADDRIPAFPIAVVANIPAQELGEVGSIVIEYGIANSDFTSVFRRFVSPGDFDLGTYEGETDIVLPNYNGNQHRWYISMPTIDDGGDIILLGLVDIIVEGLFNVFDSWEWRRIGEGEQEKAVYLGPLREERGASKVHLYYDGYVFGD